MPESEKEFVQYRRPIRRYHSLGGILGEGGALNAEAGVLVRGEGAGPEVPMVYGVRMEDSEGRLFAVAVSQEDFERMEATAAKQYGSEALAGAEEEAAIDVSRKPMTSQTWQGLEEKLGFDVAERIWHRARFLSKQAEPARVTVDAESPGA